MENHGLSLLRGYSKKKDFGQMSIPSRIDRFKILRELGKGSQGVVYLASDPRLERHVAIKTLHRQFLKHNDKRKRLFMEARTVSKLNHPNIIPLYEAGEYKDDLYLVFEYVDGISLKEHIKRKGPFVVHRAIKLMMQILDGISCAHELEVVHRDLSPSNILIDRNDLPRIMDFGISVIIGKNGNSEREIAGTPCYMSPEHFSEGLLCIQSDIFSLGLIFYEMLTASPAIEADNDFTVIYKIANEKIDPPSLHNGTVDKKLDNIIMKALERDLDRRYHSVLDMKTELNAYLNEKESADEKEIFNGQSHSTIDFLLRRIRNKSDFPTFSHNIMEINKKASVSKVNYASASELANAVLKDYSLTNKLLKLVNAAFYGQFAGKITTVSRAVVVLGFEQVRMAASCLMLFDQLKNKAQMKELREAAVSSFMSGMIAKELANDIGIDATEEAFICSMLHNLGKHLVLFYFEEEYSQIKNLMARKGMKEDSAARSVLGMSYEELGIGIAKAWKFPDKIVKSLKEMPQGKLNSPKSEEERLWTLSGFSNELCYMISSGKEGENSENLLKLLKRFEESIPLSKKQVANLLDSAKEKVEEYSDIYNVNLKNSDFLKQLDSYSESCEEDTRVPERIIESSEEFTEIKEESYQDVEISGDLNDTGEAKDPQSILINGIQDITNTLLEDFALNDVLTMILETMYRGFAFNRVVFCIMDNQTKEMRASFGFGKDIDKIIKGFRFKVTKDPDVFNFTVIQAKDVGIDDAGDARFQKRIPEWYTEEVDAPAFVLYPLVVNKRVAGLFYADRELKGKVISGSQINYMKTLCNQAVLAIKQIK